jgi:hypothetical protein
MLNLNIIITSSREPFSPVQTAASTIADVFSNILLRCCFMQDQTYKKDPHCL